MSFLEVKKFQTYNRLTKYEIIKFVPLIKKKPNYSQIYSELKIRFNYYVTSKKN